MAVRKDGTRFVVEFQVGGERIFRRLPAIATKADAVALEAKIRRDLFQRNQLGARDEPSLAAAIELWLRATEANRKDKRNPRQNAVHLRPFVEGKTIREVGDVARTSISAWNGMATAPQSKRVLGTDALEALAPATINRRLDILRASTRWAWKQGLVTDNLSGRVPRLREENARQVYLTAGEIRALANGAPNPTTKAAILIAAYTGLRASELLALGSVNGTTGSLLVSTSKNSSARSIPIVPLLRPYLSALPLGLPYRRLIGYFWLAREKAGMPHVHFHDLRHSCASMLANAGVDLFTIGKILGHSSPQTTARYSHLSDASVKAAMEKLG